MQRSKKLAKNYAQALIDLTENNISQQEEYLNELKEITQLITSVENSKKVFNSPAISKDEKKNLLNKLFQGKLNQKLLNFLFLLIDNQRFNLICEIHDEVQNLVNKSKGIIIAEVSSANELDQITLENIKKKLENSFRENGKISLKTKVEPGLIGGLKVQINDLVYDGSVKGRLENLKRRLEI